MDELRPTEPTPSYGALDDASPGPKEAQGRPSSSSSGRASPVDDLPDLTDRLKTAGIYGEYHEYRQRYLRWRKGGAQGARGELSVAAFTEASEYKFEYWYPTAFIFRWRFTTAYWIAILFLMGSFIFTFSSTVEYFGGPAALTKGPNALGACFFTVAIYCNYLQLINIPAENEDSVVYLFPNCAELAKRVNLSSVVGALSFLFGAVIFNVGVLAARYPDLHVRSKLLWVTVPNLLGGAGFTLGGLCEIAHNRIFRGGASPAEPVWWAAMADTIGGIFFFIAPLPGLTIADSKAAAAFESFSFGVGSALFIVSSMLLLAMWQVNDFGLTLLRQLNLAISGGEALGLVRARGPAEQLVSLRIQLPEEASLEEGRTRRNLSLRGAFFIVVYCWFAFVAFINCVCKHAWYQQHPHLLQHILDLGMQVFILCVIVLVLVIHSVVTQVPDEQPFHCAVVSSRFVLLCGAVFQTALAAAYIGDAWLP